MTTRLNLLPWREMRRREVDQQRLTMAVGAWDADGADRAVRLSARQRPPKTTRESAMSTCNRRLRAVEQEIKEIAGLRKQREALIARTNVIYQSQADRIQVVHVFDEIAAGCRRRVPDLVQVFRQQHLAQGVARSNARVSAFMRNLSGSNWFADPELEVINVKDKGGDRVSEFSLKVKQVAKQKKPARDGGGTTPGMGRHRTGTPGTGQALCVAYPERRLNRRADPVPPTD